MTTIDTAALRKLAEAATPGPWRFGNTGPEQRMILDSKGDYVGAVQIRQIGGGVIAESMEGRRERNATFIAAVDPTTAIALLDRLEAAEADNGRLRAALTEARDQYLARLLARRALAEMAKIAEEERHAGP